jgi:hypothetical protein
VRSDFSFRESATSVNGVGKGGSIADDVEEQIAEGRITVKAPEGDEAVVADRTV